MKCAIINNGELFETLQEICFYSTTQQQNKPKGLSHSQATLAQNLPVLHNALKL